MLLNSFALYQIIFKQLNLINLITFNTIVNWFSSSYENILGIIPQYYYLKNTIYKISEFRNIPKDKDEELLIPDLGDLKIKNLQVTYDNTIEIIKGFSYNIKINQSYFIAGISGSGKSTLIKCLQKEIINYQGDIILGDLNYRDISSKWIRDNFIVINQTEKLYSDTIYENIICHRKIAKKQFKKICQICLLDKVIKNKPLRFLSNVSDILTNLSGGERQQIILARNLLKKGKFIIIDEALSEVDMKTEIQIIKNIQKNFKNTTLLYVSHKNLKKYFSNVITMPNNKLK